MKEGDSKKSELHLMLELLNDTCNLLARKVRRQELEIIRLRGEANPEGETESPLGKKYRVN